MNKRKILERKLREDPQLKELTEEQKDEERKTLEENFEENESKEIAIRT